MPVAVAGVVVAGALLPWLSLFAGLYTYPGITAPHGWFVLGGGVLAIVAGACLPSFSSIIR